MKKTGTILTVLGVLLLVGTVIWMTVGLNILLVIPTGQDMTGYYEGEATFYVNPATQVPLPAGQELKLPLEVERRIFTIDDESTSDVILFEEDVSATFGIQKSERKSVFVLDRKESANLADNRAYDWIPSNQVDRAGTYYPLFPMGMEPDGTYYTWKAETGMGVILTYIDERTVDGVRMLVFGGPLPEGPGSSPLTSK